MTSTSVAEKFNADSSLGFSILQYETIAPYRNVDHCTVSKRPLPVTCDEAPHSIPEGRRPQLHRGESQTPTNWQSQQVHLRNFSL
jgi:hypothetical protein